eukprot:15455116-Alexandrium_andersonii.AAC.1
MESPTFADSEPRRGPLDPLGVLGPPPPRTGFRPRAYVDQTPKCPSRRSDLWISDNARWLQAFETLTVRLQKRPQSWLRTHPTRPRPGDLASCSALSPMVTTKKAGGCAGGASRG